MKKTKQPDLQTSHSVGVRLQNMGFPQQALVLARLVQARSSTAQFTRKSLDQMFGESSLPKPANLSDTIGKLRDGGLIAPGREDTTWIITPLGRQTSIELFSDLDLAALAAESMGGVLSWAMSPTP